MTESVADSRRTRRPAGSPGAAGRGRSAHPAARHGRVRPQGCAGRHRDRGPPGAGRRGHRPEWRREEHAPPGDPGPRAARPRDHHAVRSAVLGAAGADRLRAAAGSGGLGVSRHRPRSRADGTLRPHRVAPAAWTAGPRGRGPDAGPRGHASPGNDPDRSALRRAAAARVSRAGTRAGGRRPVARRAAQRDRRDHPGGDPGGDRGAADPGQDRRPRDP